MILAPLWLMVMGLWPLDEMAPLGMLDGVDLLVHAVGLVWFSWELHRVTKRD